MPLPPMPLKNIGESIMPAPLLAGWAGGKRRRFSSTRRLGSSSAGSLPEKFAVPNEMEMKRGRQSEICFGAGIINVLVGEQGDGQ
jgi:hypothetical protein